MAPRLRRFAPLVAALVLGAGLAWWLKPTPAPTYSNVIVDDAALWARRPDLTPSLGAKLTQHRVKPDQVARSAGTSGRAERDAYCAPTRIEPRVQTSATNPAPALRGGAHNIPAGAENIPGEGQNIPGEVRDERLPPFSGTFDGRTWAFQSTLNSGRLYEATFRARPRVRWRSDGDSVVVFSDRWLTRLVRRAPKCGIDGGAAAAGIGLAVGLGGGDWASAAAGAGGGAVVECLLEAVR